MSEQDLQMTFLKAYDKYADGIFRLCYFKTSDRELAKDLTQQTFMQTWSYLKAGKEVRDFRPFLYRLANNLVIDWYRRRKPESLDTLLESGWEPSDEAVDISQTADFNLALKLLTKLPADDQELIIWRYVEDLSPQQIAEIIKEKENTVSVRLHRALEKIKKIIHNQGYGN